MLKTQSSLPSAPNSTNGNNSLPLLRTNKSPSRPRPPKCPSRTPSPISARGSKSPSPVWKPHKKIKSQSFPIGSLVKTPNPTNTAKNSTPASTKPTATNLGQTSTATGVLVSSTLSNSPPPSPNPTFSTPKNILGSTATISSPSSKAPPNTITSIWISSCRSSRRGVPAYAPSSP